MFWLFQLSLKFPLAGSARHNGSAWNQLRGSCFLKLWHTSRIFNSLISCWVNYYADYVVSMFTFGQFQLVARVSQSLLFYVVIHFVYVFIAKGFSGFFRLMIFILSLVFSIKMLVTDLLLSFFLFHLWCSPRNDSYSWLFFKQNAGSLYYLLTVTGLTSFNESWKSICFWYIISFILN